MKLLKDFETVNYMYRPALTIFLLLFLLLMADSTAQTTRTALFLGNSYTGVNNLPQIIKDAALSAGDSLIFDSYTPGGTTLKDHSLSTTSKNKIMAGGWDYVVLQGQSQEPITQDIKFHQGASDLNNLINQHNPCGVTLFYMTWGRKNGDPTNCAAFPVMCTYQGMDSALREEYIQVASGKHEEVSPVSVVWRNLRQNNPGIELYQADGSHPSKAGSYAAACTFYATIFKKDPTLISFDYGLSAADASIIRNAAKTEVYDSLAKWDYKRGPRSDFRYSIGSGTNEVNFTSHNQGVRQTYHWDFGDGDTSTLPSTTHSYASNGSYTVTLTTTNCDLQGVYTSTSDTVIEFCSHTPTVSTTNPWLCGYDTLWTQVADSHQWYSGGLPIPETKSYVANYQQYNIRSFSVLSTVNGCSELSEVYQANPQNSGYYFDAAWGGDPCEGDTALFIVKHINLTLPDSGLILWYKNDTLLSPATNQDTLLITTQGIYECKVVDTTSNCPLDTTISGPVAFDCGTLGTRENEPDVFWELYPNPVSEIISIELPKDIGREEIRIYNTTGHLIKAVKASSTTKIDVTGLPSGVYYLRLKNRPQEARRFVKE